MPKRLFLFTGCLLLLTLLGAQSAQSMLTEALQKHYEASDLPGFAVSIVDEDGILYQHGFGYADIEGEKAYSPATIQNLGSVSKAIVGLALVKAIEAGQLNMDDAINDILPFPVINPYHKDNPILVGHLATHTSGILDSKHYGKSYIYAGKGGEGAAFHQDFLGFLRSHPQMSMSDFLFAILSRKGKWYRKKNFHRARPGTEQEYSNLNAALAAYLIELATGVPFQEYTQKEIFDPLKMEATAWTVEGRNAASMATRYFPNGKLVPPYALITYPDGGVYSTVEDLSGLLSEMIRAYQGQSDYLAVPFQAMLLPGDDDGQRAFWGMGQKSRNIGHGGSDPGIQTDMQFNADRKIGRIIFTNVNAEDNERLWEQYRGIHRIVAEYEDQIKKEHD